jgi:hypothetical protein
MGFLLAMNCETPWADPLTVLTGVIAAATVAYVLCTVFLWLATKKAAEAATVSADAAKKSADATSAAAGESKKSAELLAALNRPYMGVHRVAFPNPAGQNELIWGISSEIRNFGTLPALAVEARVEFVLNETVLYAAAGPFSAEIFPQSEPVLIDASFPFTGPRRDEVLIGAVMLVARIQILYAASNGQRYKHRANAQFKRGYPVFSVIDSETTML